MIRRSLGTGVLFLCVALVGTANGAQPSDCNLRRYAALALTQDASDRLLMPVTIQNTDAVMILDIGMAYSSVWQKTVDQLGLHQFPFPPASATVHWGNAVISKHTITALSLGNAKFTQADMLILPESTRGHYGIADTVAGLVGMDVLSRFDVELDIAHKQLSLYSTDHCPGQVVTWADDYAAIPMHRDTLGNSYFQIELNGKRVEALLSPSSPRSTLRADAAKQLYGIVSDKPLDTHPMQLTAKGLTIMHASMLLEGKAAPGCPLTTRDGAFGYYECLGAYPLEIGFDILSKLHLYLATKENTLYFTAAETTK